MIQFVKQKLDEDQDRRRHSQVQDNAIAPLRIAGMKFGEKREHNQESDKKPAIVQPKVTDNVTAEGMGVEFIEMESRDRAILDKWLAEKSSHTS